MVSSFRLSWLDRFLCFTATALAFGVAVSRAASSAAWRGDLPAVRDLGLVAVGIGGGVSTLATQALSFLPLGPRTFRASLVSALALAVAARLLFGLVRRTLARSSPSSSGALAGVLAFIATLTATLAPTFQREATVGGGAAIAVALALGALSLGLELGPEGSLDVRRVVATGAVLGATFAESPPASLAVAVALVAAFAASRRRGASHTSLLSAVETRALGAASAATLAVALLLLAPLALRPFAPRAWADIGRLLSASSLSALDVAGTTTTAFSAWIQEIGVVSLAVALAGAALAVARPAARPLVIPFAAIVALDTLCPARAAGVLSADAWSAVRALAVASITLASALGVHEVVAMLSRARIPMARTAAVLVVMFHLTLVALTSEEAGFAADRSEQTAAQVWTDEALERLAPASAVLVRSPALAWRLWAARLLRGERPDVMIVPIALLDRGTVATALIERGRDLEPLLRSYALTGAPSEFGLSKLADVRPLHVELDRTWSRRLVSHLTVDGLWLEYAPQPLGPSDRKAASAAALAPVHRLLAELEGARVPDPPTASLFAEMLRGHSTVLAALGDGPAADSFLESMGELARAEPFVLTRQLPYALKGLRRVAARRNEASPKRR